MTDTELDRAIALVESRKSDPKVAKLLGQSAPSYIDEQTKSRGGIVFTDMVEAFTRAKAGGFLIFSEGKYRYFDDSTKFSIYCQLVFTHAESKNVKHRYFIPASPKYSAVIIFDGTDQNEYSRLLGYIDTVFGIKAADIKIIPDADDDSTEIILTKLRGTYEDN